jgi:hypothetical protein
MVTHAEILSISLKDKCPLDPDDIGILHLQFYVLDEPKNIPDKLLVWFNPISLPLPA